MVWRGLLPPPSLPDSRTDRAGTPRKIPRPFVVDRNICHFLWYSGVAGEGLRSVGADGELPTKSVCSILPIAHHLRAGALRGPGLCAILGIEVGAKPGLGARGGGGDV